VNLKTGKSQTKPRLEVNNGKVRPKFSKLEREFLQVQSRLKEGSLQAQKDASFFQKIKT